MKRRVYIDMDDVLCDYSTAHHRDAELHPENPYPQSRKGFYEGLVPIKDALTAMSWLNQDNRFEPYILTAPSVYNPLSYTEKRLWVETHLGFEWCICLIICPDKSLLSGDILIDDRLSGHGQERFSGELLQFGSPKFPDWKTITAYLANTGKQS